MYSFKVSQLALPFLDTLSRNLPIFLNATTSINKNFVGGNGTTINFIIPDYGKVVDGPSLSEDEMSYNSATVPITLYQKHKAIGADAVQRALDISSFQDQISDPYAQEFASYMQTRVANMIKMTADHSLVFNPSDTSHFPKLAKAIAKVRQSRAYGDLCGVMGEDMNAIVASSGINLFNPTKSVEGMFLNGDIGTYNTAKFFHSQDLEPLVTGTLTLPANAKVKVAITAEGAATLVITSTSGLSGTVVPGQGFQVAGSYCVDRYGRSTGDLYTFVAQSAATASGNDIEISIKPIYFTAPNKKVSGTSVPANAAVTQLQEANSSYLSGILFAKESLVIASAGFDAITGTSQAQVVPSKGISFTITKGPDLSGFREIVRWDCLQGENLVRSNHGCSMWMKQTA